MVVLFLIVCAGTLFLYSGLLVDPATTPQWHWFYACGWVGAVGINVFVLKNRETIKVNMLDLLLIGLGGYFLIRTIGQPGFDKDSLTGLLCILVWYFIFRSSDVLKNIRLILAIVVCACFIQAAYGWMQYAGILGNHAFRIDGSFDNPAGFAASLSVGLPCCLYFFRDEKQAIQYIAYFFFVVIAGSIVLSGSRAGMLAVLCTVVFYLFQNHSRLFAPVRSYLKIIVPVLFFILLAGLYFLKKDSADGRLLIWQCTLDMVGDKPVFGHGPGGFGAKYMLYQARFFEKNPDSRFADLADNVKHPFNEYLFLLSESGSVGLIFLFIIGVVILGKYRRSDNKEIRIASACLLSLAVFSCFSYPLKYPFVWLMICLLLALIAQGEKVIYKFPCRLSWGLNAGAILISCILLGFCYSRFQAELKWHRTAHFSLLGKTKEMIPEYERLYPKIKDKPLFLYNYAAELNVIEEYNKSISILQECEQRFNDYDLQMLMAKNYFGLKDYRQAEKYYRTAYDMCPCRFLPLDNLMHVYDSIGDNNRAENIAQIIINKPVKVKSYTVSKVKMSARKRLDKALPGKQTNNK